MKALSSPGVGPLPQLPVRILWRVSYGRTWLDRESHLDSPDLVEPVVRPSGSAKGRTTLHPGVPGVCHAGVRPYKNSAIHRSLCIEGELPCLCLGQVYAVPGVALI